MDIKKRYTEAPENTGKERCIQSLFTNLVAVVSVAKTAVVVAVEAAAEVCATDVVKPVNEWKKTFS